VRPIELFIAEYVRHLTALGRSRLTLKNVHSALRKFTRFLAETGIDRIEEIDRELIEDYQQSLNYIVGKTGLPSLSGHRRSS
jgi:site-specific recombinase XerD